MLDLKELGNVMLVKIHKNLGSWDDQNENMKTDAVIPGIREAIQKDPASARMYFRQYPAHICSRLYHCWKANLERACHVQYLIGIFRLGGAKAVIVGMVQPTQWERSGDRIFCMRANDVPQNIFDKYVGQVIAINPGPAVVQYFSPEGGLEEDVLSYEEE